MNEVIKNTIADVILKLGRHNDKVHTAFLGFDACIDYIVRIVREKEGNEISSWFTESSQFGEFLVGMDNKSCGIELQTKLSKIGGNMVITANAIGRLGVKADCAGTFGFPEILPVFREMSSNCSLLTIGDTISATALEFNNSKVIMFDPGPYNMLTWHSIKNILGPDRIKNLISGKELISFLNWSEIENSSGIWEGILSEILPLTFQKGHKQYFFTDFSDCSRRSRQDIQYAVHLLGRFREYFKVHVSLNQNESRLIANAMDLDPELADEAFVRKLFTALDIDVLIIHRTNDALAYDGETFEQCSTFFCSEPMILTGGGDNFNAGFCYALLEGFPLFQSLLVANAVSGSYVKNGISPEKESLIKFLKNAEI
jgi:sugar/nucleoside kinase (ribokinase family)